MPNLAGATLANDATRLNPKIRILAMSGLETGGLSEQVRKFAGSFLVKPFEADVLLNSVSQLLHGAPADRGAPA